MSSLDRLPGGRWRVRIYANGRAYSSTFAADSERAAKRKAPRYEVALWERADADEEHVGTITELVADFMAVRRAVGLSPTTLRSYELHTGRLVARFGSMPAEDLTGRLIDGWYAEMLTEGKSPATIQHTHRVVRAVLNFGHEDRDLSRVATRQAHPPTHRTPDVDPPSPDVMRRLLADVRGEWGRAVKLAAFTGLRRGEIVGLQWTDVEPSCVTVRRAVIELPGGRVLVKEPKGKRSRRVATGAMVAAVLAEQRAVVVERCEKVGLEVSPWVFPAWMSDPTQPRRPGWISLMWGRHRAKHNATSVRLHDARHWYATTALEAGVPLSSVSAQLGHAQASTTANIYGHATDSGRDAAAKAAEDALKTDESAPGPMRGRGR